MKNIILIISLLLSIITKAQVAPSLSQGENTLMRVELHDTKNKNGYFTVGLETELGKKTQRYAILAGYTFDNLFIRNLELKPMVSYSGPDIKGIYGSFTVAYKLTDTKIRIQFVSQYRTRYTGFIGVSYTFGKIGKDIHLL